MNNLVFLDLETTGLDEGKDQILELAMAAVSIPAFDIVASMSRLVLPPMWPTVKRNLNDRVRAMHQTSGLLDDLDAFHFSGPNAHIVEGEAVAFVQLYAPHTPIWQTPLAGAGPDFDRRFVRKHMPKLHAKFSYRNFDVRSITQLQDWVFGVAHRESPHRALDDCLQAIESVRAFLGLGPAAR